MDITKENTGHLEASLKIKLTEEDYSDRIQKELREIQKKSQMPGFRPGKVPLGLINKMYGKSVKAEEINKILTDAVLDYIKDEKLDILGSPLPDNETKEAIDWESQKEFEFIYRIGLQPIIDLELSTDIEIDYYRIIVPDKNIDSFIEDSRKRYGKLIYPGVAEEGDVLSGVLTEANEEKKPIEGGKVNNTKIFIQYIKDTEVRDSLIGSKPGSEIFMDIIKAVESESEAAAMIGVKKEELEDYSPFFLFTVDSISRIEPAELNEELYEKIAPGKEIKTEEALREFAGEQFSMQYQKEVDKHFYNLASDKILEIANIELPEKFLKNWMLANKKEGLSAEDIDKEFDKANNAFKWQIIENYLSKKYNIDVNSHEIRKHMEAFVRSQLAQYGQYELPEEALGKYVDELLGKEEEVNKVRDYLFESKLIALMKDKLKLNEKDVSFEEFSELMEAEYKKLNKEQNTEPASDSDANDSDLNDPDAGDSDPKGSETGDSDTKN